MRSRNEMYALLGRMVMSLISLVFLGQICLGTEIVLKNSFIER